MMINFSEKLTGDKVGDRGPSNKLAVYNKAHIYLAIMTHQESGQDHTIHSNPQLNKSHLYYKHRY